MFELKGSSVLATGGAGFHRSNLVEHLLDIGANVRVADDFSRGAEENLQPHMKRMTLQKIDLTRLENCIEAVRGVEYIRAI